MNQKIFLTNPLSKYDEIKTKTIIHIDTHQELPYILFSDKENTIFIYDIINKKIIHSLSLSEHFPGEIIIKNLKFFNTNDIKHIKQFLDENIKIKSMPLKIRNSLIIITTQNYVLFYSFIFKNFYRTISVNLINSKEIIKCELYNSNYLIILNEEGSLIIWHIKNWTIGNIINKNNFKGKPCLNFTCLTDNKGNNYIISINKSGQIFKITIDKQINYSSFKDDKFIHENPVFDFDFNNFNNMVLTISSSKIILFNLNNLDEAIKINNFHFYDNEKITGIIFNKCDKFNQNSFVIYGNTNALFIVNFKGLNDKKLKLDSKKIKNYLSYQFILGKDMLFQGIIKQKKTIIYKAVFLNYSSDYLILGTNKGLFIIKIDNSIKTPILFQNNNNLSNDYSFFYLFENKLIEKIYNKQELFDLKPEFKNEIISLNKVFNIKETNINSLNTRYEIQFSYDKSYLSCLDSCSEIFCIFKIIIINNKYNFELIHNGESLSLEWCPYENIFGITKKKELYEKNKDKISSFILQVFQINNENEINLLYEEDNLNSHKIYNGPYLGILIKSINNNNYISKDLISNFIYNLPKETEFNFYYWDEKKKLEIKLDKEPIKIYNTESLEYMIICYEDKFIIYEIKENTYLKKSICYFKVIDALIYENILFLFLTDYGIYFIILNEEQGIPFKLMKFSYEMNNIHLKISGKFKENNIIYPNKLFQQKLIGIYNNNLISCNNLGEVQISKIDNNLITLIHLICKREFSEIHNLLNLIDIREVNSVVSIFKFFFGNDEKIYRKIFPKENKEMILKLKLYKYFNFFIQDFISSKSLNCEKEIKEIYKNNLLKNIIDKNIENLNQIYNNFNQLNLINLKDLTSRCINEEKYFSSLIESKQFSQAFVFNEIYNLNNNSQSLLKQNIDFINNELK